MAPWPHYPNKNVFSDRRNLLYDKSVSFACDGRQFHIVQVHQLQILYRRRCPHHNLQCMFDTLWTERIVVARKHRQKDSGWAAVGYREVPDSDRWTSVADWRRRSEPTATGSPVLPRYIPKNRELQ